MLPHGGQDGGQETAEYTYSMYGLPSETPDSALAFTGHRYESDLGLIDAKGRFYDPIFGVFLSPDPFTEQGGSPRMNRYAYTGYDPVNYVDPSGNFIITAAIVGAVIGAAVGAYTYHKLAGENATWTGYILAGLGGGALGFFGAGYGAAGAAAVAEVAAAKAGLDGLAASATVIGAQVGATAGAGALAGGAAGGGVFKSNDVVKDFESGVASLFQQEGFVDRDRAIAHRDMAIVHQSNGVEYSSVVYRHEGRYHYTEPQSIHSPDTAPDVRDHIELGLIPEGAEIINLGHTHPIPSNAVRDELIRDPLGWHDQDYQSASARFRAAQRGAGVFSDYSISPDYTETVLSQTRTGGRTRFWAHTLRIGSMVRGGVKELGSTKRVRRKYIIEGVRGF